MAIKTYRPVTSTLRFQTTLVNEDLTRERPHKPLTETKKGTVIRGTSPAGSAVAGTSASCA
jgi:ribosomal protein L2